MRRLRFAFCGMLALCGMLLAAPSARAHTTIREMSVLVDIEPDRVSYHILIWFPAMEQLLDLKLREPGQLHLAEYAAIKKQVAEALGRVNRVVIDGMAVPPRLDAMQITFEPVKARPAGEPDPLSYPTADAKVTLEVTHPTAGTPQAVRMHWGMLPERVKLPEPQSIPDPGGIPVDELKKDPDLADIIVEVPPEPGADPEAGDGAVQVDDRSVALRVKALGYYDYASLSEANPVYTWRARDARAASRPVDQQVAFESVTRPWPAHWPALLGLLTMALAWVGWARDSRAAATVAQICLLLGGAMLCRVMLPPAHEQVRYPKGEQGRRLAEAMLKNIYRAGLYERESDVYDMLAASADGDYLERLYRQLVQSAASRAADDPSKATSHILGVQVLESRLWTPTEPIDPPAFTLACRWRVDGRVSHYNHVHRRTNEYRAEFQVASVDGAWKLVDGQAVEQFRKLEPDHDR